MKLLWNVVKYATAFLATVGLVFSSGVFSLLLYGKITGKDWAISYEYADAAPLAGIMAQHPAAGTPSPEPTATPPMPEKKASVLLDAPVFRQHPELPSGCEITSLSMLLHFAGVEKTKMDLLPDMPRDTTPLKSNASGAPVYWGNPNTGFVGEISGKGKGFGIFHTALIKVLEMYVPTAVDLTGSSFDVLEERLSMGVPAVVWTTINFQIPTNWVTWDTPIGPIKSTFVEHAVLLVGYDSEYVYVNDPWTGKANYPVNKQLFIEIYEAMGSQAISYDPPA